MKTPPILIVFLIVASTLGMPACNHQPAPPELPKSPNFVQVYVRATPDVAFEKNNVHLNGVLAKIEIGPAIDPGPKSQSIEVYHNDIILSGHLHNAELFEQTAIANQDTHYDDWSSVGCFLQPNTRVDITSDKAYAAGYPAGASLNDLFRIRAWDIHAFIEGGYDTKNPALWGETVSWYSDGAQIVQGVLAPDTPLTVWNTSTHRLFPIRCVLLSDRMPDTAGEYRFTVTFTFEDGSTAGFTTQPVALSVHAD